MRLTETELGKKILQLFDEDDKELVLIETGDWISEHKYESKETVVQYQDKYYSIINCRSGSYYSDYEYLDAEIYEVMPVEYKAIKWVQILPNQ